MGALGRFFCLYAGSSATVIRLMQQTAVANCLPAALRWVVFYLFL